MFEVVKQTISNPFKPEIVDSTTIVLKQSKPFVQMSYKYEGDFSNLSDKEAINKVLEDFYKDNYKEKIQEGKLAELELEVAKLKQSSEEYDFQNDILSQSVIELTEVLLKSLESSEALDDETIDSVEETDGVIEEGVIDESDSAIDGTEN